MRPILVSLILLVACDSATPVAGDLDGDGFRPIDGDCDDGRSDVYPLAPELCDAGNVDEDCDGLVNDADPSLLAEGLRTVWFDADGDGFGLGEGQLACAQAPGQVEQGGDCDDTRIGVAPGGIEVCDAEDLDEDCSGAADDADPEAEGQSVLVWTDADGDGFGVGAGLLVCDAQPGTAGVGGDCDDDQADRNPAAIEVCDPFDVDEDCDGLADDADFAPAGTSIWYADADSDGTGNAETATLACDPGALDVAVAGDCNDNDATVSPLAVETCDDQDIDEDCNGTADDADPNPVGETPSWVDSDGDGFGAGDPTLSCELPAGSAAVAADCNDETALVSPAALEVCDALDVDENCDGNADDADSAATGQTPWYPDLDEDGFGAGRVSLTCDPLPGYVADATDCDDDRMDVHPAAVEFCDDVDVDEDCNGVADDDDVASEGGTPWFTDSDADGFGDPTTLVIACDPAFDEVKAATDCDDARSDVSPVATEFCDGSNTDEDCDGLADDSDGSALGQTAWYADFDVDGFGAGLATLSCDSLGGVAVNTDCNDARNDVSPAGTEVCDVANTDEDCDALADDLDVAPVGVTPWYADADLDGYGAGAAVWTCDALGRVATADDCDDARDDVSPSAAEFCDVGNMDEDCDGLSDDADPSASGQTTWFVDVDGDDFGAGPGFSACEAGDAVANAEDCDDTLAQVSPAGTEVCDVADLDEDCDGSSDDLDIDVVGQQVVFADLDADGFGAGAPLSTCDFDGKPALANDCDDTRDDVYPHAVEIECDGVVQACGGRDADVVFPGDAPSLTVAIEMAAVGDTVCVGAGTWPASNATVAADHVSVRSVGGSDVTRIEAAMGTTAILVDNQAGFSLAGFTISGTNRSAVFVDNVDNVAISDVTFVDTVTTERGGGLRVTYSGDVSIVGSAFVGNQASQGGGLVVSDVSSVNIEDCWFEGNVATEEGGGLFADESLDLLVANSTFVGNSADLGGGAWVVESGTLVVDTTFEGNAALESGGGLGVDFTAAAQVVRATFVGNTAYAGAGFHSRYDVDTSVSESSFVSNVSTEAGGALAALDSVRLHVAGCDLSDNAANFGGGVYLLNTEDASIATSLIEANTAESGGGLFALNADALTVAGCELRNNSAFLGGGVYVELMTGTTTVSGGLIEGNMATSNGGGLFAYEVSTLALEEQKISGNDSGGMGGGVYAVSTGIVATDSAITLNSAVSVGGGVRLLFGTWTSVGTVLDDNLPDQLSCVLSVGCI